MKGWTAWVLSDWWERWGSPELNSSHGSRNGPVCQVPASRCRISQAFFPQRATKKEKLASKAGLQRGQLRGVSYTWSPHITLTCLEMFGFCLSFGFFYLAQVCQTLELFLCLWDQFASDRSKKSSSGWVTQPWNRLHMGLPQPIPLAAAPPALRRKCWGVRSKCRFVWFSGFETAPGSTVPTLAPAFTKSWLWPTQQVLSSPRQRVQAVSVFLKGCFWHKGNVDGNNSGLSCLK